MTTSKQVNEALGVFMRSSERMVKGADITEFWTGLEAMCMALINDSPVAKSAKQTLQASVQKVLKRLMSLPEAQQTKFIDLLEKANVDAMSPEDAVRFWQALGATIDPSKTYDAQSKVDSYQRQGGNGDPDKGTGRKPLSPTFDSDSPHLPASTSPSPESNRAIRKTLGGFAGMKSEDLKKELELAKTGLSQLEPEATELAKAQEGRRLQAVDANPDSEDELLMYMGRINGETETPLSKAFEEEEQLAKESAIKKVEGGTALIEHFERLLHRG